MKRILLIILLASILFGCSSKKPDSEDAAMLKGFAQRYAEQYLEKNNLYDENSEYYISYSDSNKLLFEYYLFCDDRYIAKIQLVYSEEPMIGGLIFTYHDGYISGTVTEDYDQKIKAGSDKIYLNDSIEMNYITAIEVVRLEMTVQQLEELEKKAIAVVETEYLSRLAITEGKYELVSYLAHFMVSVDCDEETLLIKQLSTIDFILLKDGKPLIIVRLDSADSELWSLSEYSNILEIDFSKTENLKKVFTLSGVSYPIFNKIVISDNDYLNNLSFQSQDCIIFIIRKAYDRAVLILDEISELAIIKSW
ncbi:MAG TPA: hypothetical protein PK631_02350 [Erysipelotrichaceae bacterium]|nr:hypothetical protein [Erysipelotrichaceae bacterium]